METLKDDDVYCVSVCLSPIAHVWALCRNYQTNYNGKQRQRETDRQTDRRSSPPLNAPYTQYVGRGLNKTVDVLRQTQRVISLIVISATSALFLTHWSSKSLL